jgi:hypothetical protein
MLYGLRRRELVGWFRVAGKPAQWDRLMNEIRFGLGTVWIIFTILATALLGTDFILNEIRSYFRRDGESETQ